MATIDFAWWSSLVYVCTRLGCSWHDLEFACNDSYPYFVNRIKFAQLFQKPWAVTFSPNFILASASQTAFTAVGYMFVVF